MTHPAQKMAKTAAPLRFRLRNDPIAFQYMASLSRFGRQAVPTLLNLPTLPTERAAAQGLLGGKDAFTLSESAAAAWGTLAGLLNGDAAIVSSGNEPELYMGDSMELLIRRDRNVVGRLFVLNGPTREGFVLYAPDEEQADTYSGLRLRVTPDWAAGIEPDALGGRGPDHEVETWGGPIAIEAFHEVEGTGPHRIHSPAVEAHELPNGLLSLNDVQSWRGYVSDGENFITYDQDRVHPPGS